MGHTRGGVYGVIVCGNKILQHVNVAITVFIRKVFVHFSFQRPVIPFHDRTFDVRVSTYLKLNVCSLQERLKGGVKKLFTPVAPNNRRYLL